MLDKAKLGYTIQSPENYLRHLRELRKLPMAVFLEDWKIFDLADREIQLALETYLTLGEMLICEWNLPKPETYADIPRILRRAKIISTTLEQSLVDLARFRNILVHQYTDLDHKRIYERLPRDIEALQRYLKVIKNRISCT